MPPVCLALLLMLAGADQVHKCCSCSSTLMRMLDKAKLFLRALTCHDARHHLRMFNTLPSFSFLERNLRAKQKSDSSFIFILRKRKSHCSSLRFSLHNHFSSFLSPPAIAWSIVAMRAIADRQWRLSTAQFDLWDLLLTFVDTRQQLLTPVNAKKKFIFENRRGWT